ncbi:MAG: MASE1 domain-containing protein [Planctomycetes bacterium]|nr:MASE1 domain-containing protein [Planctomycetota bacterium]
MGRGEVPKLDDKLSRLLVPPFSARALAALFVVAFIYFAAARFGLSFARMTTQVSAVFPATGIAVAALLLLGLRAWPAILVGAYVTNSGIGDWIMASLNILPSGPLGETPLTALGISVGNTLGPVAGVWLLRRVKFDSALSRPRDIGLLVVFGAMLGMAITATNGVFQLCLAEHKPWSHFGAVWWVWWMGDAMGVVLVAPLILAWVKGPPIAWSRALVAESVAFTVVALFVSLFVLTNLFQEPAQLLRRAYLLFPFVIWAALRLGQRGTTLIVFAIVVLALWGVATLPPQGTAALQMSHEDRLVALDIFAAAIALTGFFLAAAIADRSAARNALQLANSELETRVMAHTRALESATADLEQKQREVANVRALVESAPNAMLMVDGRGKIVLVNRQAEVMFGYPRDELIGSQVERLVPERWRGSHPLEREKFMASPSARAMGVGRELFGMHKDGHEIPIEIGLNPINTADGMCVLAAVIDITERRRLEAEQLVLHERMQHAQKLESLGVMAGGIAHDFNNLLMAILGNTEIALSHQPRNTATHEHLKQIEAAARRAADLTRQMLAYAGKGRFQVVPMSLSMAVEEMAHLLQVSVSKRATMKYTFARELPLIEADPAQISQVVMNLITNASEALEDRNGTITLATGSVVVDAAYLATCVISGGVEPGRFVFIEVSDTGSGMDAVTVKRMFEPFFTTKFKGRGLGLAAVLGIMRSHRGAIRVYSEPGHGTTVRVLFPVMPLPQSLEAPAETARSWSGEGTVLVIDDEESVRSIARVMLAELGYTVLVAEDGLRGIEVFKQSPEKIVAVLLDMTMPQLNGEETFRELRRIKPDVRVILSSGYPEEDTLRRFKAAGLAGFVQKPYTPQQLADVLRKVFQTT